MNGSGHADLEIGLHRRDAGSYTVELRFSLPDSDADTRLLHGIPLLQADFAVLRELSHSVADYGHALAAALFADADLKAAFAQACSHAQTLAVPLRLRLFIGADTPELHDLRWETLRHPQDDTPLLTGEQVLFSRYLSSFDWRPVRLRARAGLRALVLIANPTNLADYRLAAVDVAGELERARHGLGAAVEVSTPATGEYAGLNTLSARLRDGADILYLVCHGTLRQGEAWLWLEDEAGRVARVAGSELVNRLGELRQLPRLVVLAACRSAGSGEPQAGDGSALAALGPRLAEAGVPAVLAMQGGVTMATVARFMPAFFAELQRSGELDRAMAVARGAVRDRPDWWMPVLFMRLKSGRLWYTPGFGGEANRLEKWPALLKNICQGRCTPILGSGLTDTMLGSRRELARRWAETYHFPMAPQDCEALPQVAQYLAVNQQYMFPRDELMDYLRQVLLERYGGELDPALRNAPLDRLSQAVGSLLRARNAAEPHAVLAQLPFAIYITTNVGNLLEAALQEAGKEPQLELCRWNKDLEHLSSLYDQRPDYRPSPQQPLIYQLFGRLQEPNSLVLTEDDYFDFLIGVTRNQDLIPAVVRRALVDGALLFLGFEMDDWNFRILYRSIISREGGGRRRGYTHVAAQINPEGGRILEPERARRYLESYFQGADISLYWGSAEEFLKELQQRWREIRP